MQETQERQFCHPLIKLLHMCEETGRSVGNECNPDESVADRYTLRAELHQEAHLVTIKY